jgi:hypothetical protein
MVSCRLARTSQAFRTLFMTSFFATLRRMLFFFLIVCLCLCSRSTGRECRQRNSSVPRSVNTAYHVRGANSPAKASRSKGAYTCAASIRIESMHMRDAREISTPRASSKQINPLYQSHHVNPPTRKTSYKKKLQKYLSAQLDA